MFDMKPLCILSAILLTGLTLHGKVITLTNDAIEVKVSTQTGHTISLAPPNEPNLLYEADGDLGGEALHPLQQVQLWFLTGPVIGPLQPDPTFWDSPWKVISQTGDALVLESEVSPLLKLKATRTYQLLGDQPALEVTTTLKRVAPNPYPVHVWSITQLKRPNYVLLDVEEMPGPDYLLPWKELSRPGRLESYMRQPLEGAVMFRVKGQTFDNPKLGTLGDWVATIVRPGLALVKSVPLENSGCYPDGTSMQAYANQDFTEIETLSVNQHLQPGETLTSRSVWQLVRAPEDSSPETWIQQIEKAVESVPQGEASP